MKTLSLVILLWISATCEAQIFNCDDCNAQDVSSKNACETYIRPFQIFTQPVVSDCKQDPIAYERRDLVDNAKNVLADAGFFAMDEFEGVEYLFCENINGTLFSSDNVQAIAYVEDTVIFRGDYREARIEKFATVFAHEMQHIRQYRQLGYDGFACEYSNQVMGGNTGRDNLLEKEAYELSDTVEDCLESGKGCP